MNWNGYVSNVAHGETQDQIGRRIGVTGASVSRWKQSGPKPLTAAAFARAYGRPVLEAFVAAGFLTADEAGEMPTASPSLDDLSDADLLSEIRKRMEARHDRQDSQPGPETGSTQHSSTDRSQDGSTPRQPGAPISEDNVHHLDQGVLQPPPAPEKSVAWETRNRGKEIREQQDRTED